MSYLARVELEAIPFARSCCEIEMTDLLSHCDVENPLKRVPLRLWIGVINISYAIYGLEPGGLFLGLSLLLSQPLRQIGKWEETKAIDSVNLSTVSTHWNRVAGKINSTWNCDLLRGISLQCLGAPHADLNYCPAPTR